MKKINLIKNIILCLVNLNNLKHKTINKLFSYKKIFISKILYQKQNSKSLSKPS